MENSRLAASPRISFSHNLLQSPVVDHHQQPRLDDSLPLDPPEAAEFDFSISSEVSGQDPSPADELFSDGKILPLPIKRRTSSSTRKEHPLAPQSSQETLHHKKGSLREMMAVPDVDGRAGVKSWAPRQTLWRFGRSSSAGPSSRTVICPFPLARSRSAGPPPSTMQLVRNPITIHESKPLRRDNRPPLSLQGGGYCGENVILNVPAPFISKGRSTRTSSRTSVLAYLLCNCNDKRCTISSSP